MQHWWNCETQYTNWQCAVSLRCWFFAQSCTDGLWNTDMWKTIAQYTLSSCERRFPLTFLLLLVYLLCCIQVGLIVYRFDTFSIQNKFWKVKNWWAVFNSGKKFLAYDWKPNKCGSRAGTSKLIIIMIAGFLWRHGTTTRQEVLTGPMASAHGTAVNRRPSLLALQPSASLVLWTINNSRFFWDGLLAPNPTPNLENQALHFIWPIHFDLSGTCGTTRSLCSRQHSSLAHLGMQTSPPWYGGCPLKGIWIGSWSYSIPWRWWRGALQLSDAC
jgi:hypothetical protein